MSKVRTLIAIALASGMSALPARAQNDLRDIPAPDADAELRSFEMAEGFRANLYASDPDIAKPIHMNFDERGRLWVVSSATYPHIIPGAEHTDQIVVLEDADGDGTAEKATVFADDLIVPTGIAIGDGGVYVANSTEMLHLSDTDGDGRADRRRVILSGFGIEDTHHILHTFRWGPDGMLYFNQSIYIHSHLETPFGVRRLDAGGIWQFRPETGRAEVFMYGLVNSWGHSIDRFGQSFATDGAGGEGINYVIPGAYYVTAKNAPRILQGLNPGSPKHCGLEIVGGRHLPDDWQGNLLTNDFRGHRVARFILSEDGAGFASREAPELIRSEHVAFRPVDIKMGPDGAIYIADWYNPIIQHGEVDFRDERRDHTHGRIWRVTYEGRPLVTRPDLTDRTVPELLGHLKSAEDFTREQARRLIKEASLRGGEAGREATARAVDDWIGALDPDAPDHEQSLLEALWVHQSMDLVNAPLLERLASASDHRVRAAALRVVPHWGVRLDQINGDAWCWRLLSDRAGDGNEHPRVKLEAVRSLGRIRWFKSTAGALGAYSEVMDRFLEYGLWLTMRDLSHVWVPILGSLASPGEDDSGTPILNPWEWPEAEISPWLFAVKAADTPETNQLLISILGSPAISDDQRTRALQLLSKHAGPAEFNMLLDRVTDASVPADARASLLEGLLGASASGRLKPDPEETAALLSLLDESHVRLGAAAARACGEWKVEAARAHLLDLARGAELDSGLRVASVNGLTGLGGADSVTALESLAAPDYPADVRLAAVDGLVTLDAPRAARTAASILADADSLVDSAALVSAFTRRKGAPPELARALEGLTLSKDRAKLASRVASRATGIDPALDQAIRAAGGLGGDPEPPTPDEIARMSDRVKRSGDPAAGEMIYRRSEMQCVRCHAIGGAGGRVGPDLTSVGASAQIDYLIESLLLPDKAVKEGFHSLVVTTADGQVLSGIPVRETDSELVLRDSSDSEVPIAKDSITDRRAGISLMPAELTAELTDAELSDLVSFLSALGRERDWSVGTDRVVRSWERLLPGPKAEHLLHAKGYQHAASTDPELTWSSVTSRVSGELDLAGVDPVRPAHISASFHFVRFGVNVSLPGEIGIQLSHTDNVSVWAGGEPVEPGLPLRANLERGEYVVTLAIRSDGAPRTIRAELTDIEGSPAIASLATIGIEP